MAGARDYLGPKLCREPISGKRLEAVIAFFESNGRSKKSTILATDTETSASSVPAAKNWKNVEAGKEYKFYMMFIELDGYRDISHRIGEAAVGRLLLYFQKTVEKFVANDQGRLWIWNDFGGIILFPIVRDFNNIIAACLRLMLSRRIISIEQNEHKLLFSYRVVLYEGSTVYRERGKTGRIISDAVNSLSHIGTKFARPGNFYLTGTLLCNAKPKIKECFLDAGCYEGTPLDRMKLPQRF
jgi:hypothetical protein